MPYAGHTEIGTNRQTMIITKKTSKDNEFYLYMNGKFIYKKWLNTGQSKIFDVMAYNKYTYVSYTDLTNKNEIADKARKHPNYPS